MLANVPWLKSANVRPYIFMRKENLFAQPGSRHQCDWFTRDVLYKDPLKMAEVKFADQILKLEGMAFSSSDMKMPRWVFYDCSVVPGFVSGFVAARDSLSPEALKILNPPKDLDWVPISLFIIIPTVRPGEWVAHNLCTVNSLLGSDQNQYYALGFMTKAFGLWYANVDILCGMTQWTSPSLKLHSHFGSFQVMTAYTPVHSYAQTLTYKCKIDTKYWNGFFDRSTPDEGRYTPTGYVVQPGSEESLIEFQGMIEAEKDIYYLKAMDIRRREAQSPLPVYRLANRPEKP